MTDIKDNAVSNATALSKLSLSQKESILGENLEHSKNLKLYEMTQEAAYYVAEKNRFYGDPQEFWIEAEAQINGMLFH